MQHAINIQLKVTAEHHVKPVVVSTVSKNAATFSG